MQNLKLIAMKPFIRHTTHLKHYADGKDDPEMAIVAAQCKDEAMPLMPQSKKKTGLNTCLWLNDCLNKDILCQYVEYITNARMTAVGLPGSV